MSTTVAVLTYNRDSNHPMLNDINASVDVEGASFRPGWEKDISKAERGETIQYSYSVKTFWVYGDEEMQKT